MFFKNFSSVLVADVLGISTSAIFWIVFASLVEPSKYGEISFYLGIASFVSYIALIGTQETQTVLISKKIPVESTFSFLGLSFAAIASLIVLIFLSKLDLVFLTIAYVVNVIAISQLLGKKLYSKYAKYFLVQKILTLILGLGCFYIFGPDSILYALSVTYVMYLIILIRNFKRNEIKFSLLKPKMNFIINNYAIMVTNSLYTQLDKFIIAPLLGFALLGNYSLGLQFVGIMLIFPNALFKFILPNDSVGISNKKLKRFSILISVIISALGFILSPILIPIFFPQYTDVIIAVQILSVNVIIQTLISILTSKFMGLEQNKYLLINKFLNLIVLSIGMISLGLLYGIVGLCIAYIINSIISLLFLIIVKRKFLKI